MGSKLLYRGGASSQR